MPKPMSPEQIDYFAGLDKGELEALPHMLNALGVPAGTQMPYEIADLIIEVFNESRQLRAYDRAMKVIGY